MRAGGWTLRWTLAAATVAAAAESPLTLFLKQTLVLTDAQTAAVEARTLSPS